MSQSISQLEDLPNEVLADIFEYIDASRLFRSFHNLNARFNRILKSLNNLHLCLMTTCSSQKHQNKNMAQYVRILSIYGQAQLNLNHFTNVHRLTLVQTSDELIEQFERLHLFSLKHITIILGNRRDEERIPYFWNRIFTFDCSRLEICCMHNMSLTWTTSPWKQISSLRILKIGDIDLLVYETILLSCPNLEFLKFTRLMSTSEPKSVIQHRKLKELIIIIPWFERPSLDCDMKKYFAYVPNIEKLILHRTNEAGDIDDSLLKFHWYSSSINLCLPLLSCFIYYFHIFKCNRYLNSTTQPKYCEIQQHFYSTYQHLKRCKFALDFIG